jgi:hypothetical protein
MQALLRGTTNARGALHLSSFLEKLDPDSAGTVAAFARVAIVIFVSQKVSSLSVDCLVKLVQKLCIERVFVMKFSELVKFSRRDD